MLTVAIHLRSGRGCNGGDRGIEQCGVPDRNGGKATDQLELLEHLKFPETYKGIDSLLETLVEHPKEVSPNLEKVYRVPHPLHWRSEELRESLRRKFF